MWAEHFVVLRIENVRNNNNKPKKREKTHFVFIRNLCVQEREMSQMVKDQTIHVPSSKWENILFLLAIISSEEAIKYKEVQSFSKKPQSWYS